MRPRLFCCRSRSEPACQREQDALLWLAGEWSSCASSWGRCVCACDRGRSDWRCGVLRCEATSVGRWAVPRSRWFGLLPRSSQERRVRALRASAVEPLPNSRVVSWWSQNRQDVVTGFAGRVATSHVELLLGALFTPKVRTAPSHAASAVPVTARQRPPDCIATSARPSIRPYRARWSLPVGNCRSTCQQHPRLPGAQPRSTARCSALPADLRAVHQCVDWPIGLTQSHDRVPELGDLNVIEAEHLGETCGELGRCWRVQ